LTDSSIKQEERRMGSESEATTDAATDENVPASPYTLLAEWEGALISTRQAEYETLQTLLGNGKTALTKSLFVRFALNRAPAHYLEDLLAALGRKVQQIDKLAREVEDGITLYLTSSDTATAPAAVQLIEASHQRGLATGLLTSRPETLVETWLSRQTVTAPGTRIFSYPANHAKGPRADAWLKAVRTLKRTPRQCIALTGSEEAARAALTAGLRCIVITDAFTVHQDFSGVDCVIEPGESCDAHALLDRLSPPLTT
jgi:beta-phosphoglucomutase-like phosphatase (HAD superfamily)